MILELAQPRPLDTPKGKALALFLIDNGTDSDLQWVCVVKETGECWTFRNPEIRWEKNVTMGIRSATADAPGPVLLRGL